jgi:cytosine/uracil/thiamine/allantoin permease
VVLGLLGVAFVGECVLNYDDASLLWRHPLGVRMVLPAVATVTFGIAVFLGSSLLINLLLPAANENRRLARRIVSGLLALAVFVLFFLPAFYVVLVGPSAIQILETIR